MSDDTPLYSSRIVKIYLEYLRRNHSYIDIGDALDYAGMTRAEVAEPSYWFTQLQMDRLNDYLVAETGNPDIAREGGRFAASTQAIRPAIQYLIGLMNLTTLYRLIGKVYPMFSRAADVRANILGPTRIEVVSVPKPGVLEKRYQCRNRIGMFESVAQLYTGKYAEVREVSCIHDGDDACRYEISWREKAYIRWRRFCRFFLPIGSGAVILLALTVHPDEWTLWVVSVLAAVLAITVFADHKEKQELVATVNNQGNAADELIEEINIRHDNALLVEEIGQAASTIKNTEKLLNAVMNIIETRIDFDRGMIMLADPEKKRLVFSAGFGYDPKQRELLRGAMFHLDKPEANGAFVKAFWDQKPLLVNSLDEIERTLSRRSLEFARALGVRSLICVPLCFEKESLGILALDNIRSKRVLTKSDLHLLMGVASQTAIAIVNARSFQTIKESEKKYRELVENANSIIMRLDTAGRVTFFNEFAQEFFGYPENEIIGRRVLGAIFPNTAEGKRDLSYLVESLRNEPGQRIVSEGAVIIRNSQSAWIAWTYRPIFNRGGQLQEILCIGNDITKLKQAENEKRELENRLQRAQKMEAIGTLAGGVAHDLNNILSGLVSYPELLLMDIPEDSPLRHSILTIKKSGERAASIVTDLLTMARRGVGITEPLNLNDMVIDYLNSPEHRNISANIPGIRIETRLEKNLIAILGSSVHLTKTLMNLVLNAAEAMPSGGDIVISTANRYVDTSINGYDEVLEGDYVTLSVTDTGTGISATDLERIFEPFYTKKVMGKSGTGLGMAVVWGTVKDHRGYIDVHSDLGRGTTFALYFPVTDQVVAKRGAVENISEFMGQGEKILVVDDIPEQRHIASGMLTKLGYSVATAADGEKAVEYMQNNTADLLVLDMIMKPGMDGLETYRKILQTHPEQRAVIVSGFSESERVKEAQKLGAGVYVRKPFLLGSIGRAARRELDR